ncbi:hypothetical protein AAC387_Pa03g1946 [Persea americana]
MALLLLKPPFLDLLHLLPRRQCQLPKLSLRVATQYSAPPSLKSICPLLKIQQPMERKGAKSADFEIESSRKAS